MGDVEKYQTEHPPEFFGMYSSPSEMDQFSEEPKDNYPKLLVRDSDTEDMQDTPHLDEREQKALFSSEKTDEMLQAPDEEDVVKDFLLSISTSFTEAKPNGKLHQSPEQEEFEAQDEENMTSISEPVSQHPREESTPSSSEFCSEKSSSSEFCSEKSNEKIEVNRVLIDTAAPFESVKAAVSKFGGILDWKAHRVQTLERQKLIEQELVQAQEEIPIYKKHYQDAEAAKVHLFKELDSTKRLIEELKLNLERAQTEDQQAKQDAELVKLRVEELEQGIEAEASISAKTQLEVARSRHIAAKTDLKMVKNELEQLGKDYELLALERDRAVKKAEVSVSSSKEVEKLVEEMTIDLINVKESLGLAHGAHLEAEEEKISADVDREEERLNCEKELKEADKVRQRLELNILVKKDSKKKLDTKMASLVELKSELAAYVETKSESDSENEVLQKELEEVKLSIGKAFIEINSLKMAEASRKLEIERERSEIYAVKQKEEIVKAVVSSFKAELSESQAKISSLQMKESERRERMTELPMQLQIAGQESDETKMLAQLAREEWQKQNNYTEQAKSEASTMESRLVAVQKETEAAKASEKLALAAINAVKENDDDSNSQEGIITLSLEEYYVLSKRAHEAQERADEMMASAESQINMARESASKTSQKLEEVGLEMVAQKEALVVAIHKAENAKEAKLSAEQEFRMWRAENGQRRKDYVQESKNPRLSFENSSHSSNFIHMAHTVLPQKGYVHENDTENDASAEVKDRKKKKKSLLPRLFMFLARRKAHANKFK